MNRENISDGYHTFGELYALRRLYHAYAVQHWIQQGYQVVKSWRHYEGASCFGGGWFIVQAVLPSGQVSQHYEAQYWDEFDCPSVARADKWDGHTTRDAIRRLADQLHEDLLTERNFEPSTGLPTLQDQN